jgi:hypothetical protein
MRDDSLETFDGFCLVSLVEHLRIKLNICEGFVLTSLKRVSLSLSGLICRSRVLNYVTVGRCCLLGLFGKAFRCDPLCLQCSLLVKLLRLIVVSE